ncbi:hypothetical protein QTG54_000909 [Skeletonema marinoi]|uniref:Uncharacterized protein n=1 Tax=Skeletonema marinoi TaxID=267567 RepID=A0AAD8YPL4_9STRA|nr:hypothetical protein QTG54_000909 [Skeletonema marinoi]
MEPQSCDCTPSTLFERAMDLIDPPRWLSDAHNNKSSRADDNMDRGEDTSHHEIHDDENETEPMVKKVKFEESTCFAPRTISAADAIRAYDLLDHAASMTSSLSRGDLTQIDWNKVQIIADVYRALLVTSCLLLELLPERETSAASATQIDDSIEQPCRQTKNENCPLIRTAADHIPVLSPAIEQGLLSTARRCILLLQALERICTAKSVAENTSRGASTNLFSAGGDDIHDYDRSEPDLVSNYDWHDDGHLPLPFCQSKILERHCRSSVLHECCYLPVQQDPPCSRFERNAWTRHWFRGERLVSMNITDHIDNAQYDDIEIPSEDIEEQSRGEGDIPLPESSGSNHGGDGDESNNNIVLSEGNRKKRRRTKISTVKQTALVEDRNDIVKEGFLLLSCDSCDATPLFNDDGRVSIHRKGFLRVYCKLHPSGWLSIEDRSILLKTDDDSPLTHRRKSLKYLIYSETTCQPCLPDGTMSFHFRLDAARFLGPSMLFNHGYEGKGSTTKNDKEVCKLLFAVDDDAGSTFADGCEWVNALSGAAAKAASLRDQIRQEWNGLER